MIPGLPSLGGAELLIMLAIVLLFFGARRLPELGRSLGRGLKDFREELTANKKEPEKKDEEEEDPEAIEEREEEKEQAKTRG